MTFNVQIIIRSDFFKCYIFIKSSFLILYIYKVKKYYYNLSLILLNIIHFIIINVFVFKDKLKSKSILFFFIKFEFIKIFWRINLLKTPHNNSYSFIYLICCEKKLNRPLNFKGNVTTKNRIVEIVLNVWFFYFCNIVFFYHSNLN